MSAEDLAYIEDSVLRMIQKKTGPRWAQQYHNLEAIKEALLGPYFYRPRTTMWYVDQVVGNDTTGDGSEGKPYKTVAKAESVAGARDTIVVWGGFTENVTIDVAGIRLLGLGMGLSTIGGAIDDTPIITLDANGFEVAGLIINGTAKTGHGIRIIGSHDFYIHDNTIRNITGAYDGIDKSSGAISYRGKIVGNTIMDGAGAGIGLVNFQNGKIIGNKLLRNTSHGIVLSPTCDYNEIEENRALENNVGIELQGDNNYPVKNICQGNTVRDLEDSGTNNRWENNKFHQIISATHTTTGAVEEIVFTDRCIQSMTRESGYLRLINMVGGDDFTFRTYKSYDAGGTWDLIDVTNLVGVQIIQRYNWDLTLENRDEQLQVTIQRNGAVDRAFIHRRVISSE